MLYLDKSILEAQIALDLLHLQSKFYDLSHLKLSMLKAETTSQRIIGYCKEQNVKLDFVVLQFFRPDHLQLNQHEQQKCKAREKEIRPHLDAMADASKAVGTFFEDPESLLEGRLRFRFHG